MSTPLHPDVIERLPAVMVRFLPRTMDAAEADAELATTTALPRVKELNDAVAAALLATAPMPTAVKDASDECPKCGIPARAGTDACASCGLASERMATFTAERDQAVPDAIRRAWDLVIARWEDEAGHDALFQMIAERGEYGWAAGRYRVQARERSGDTIARRHMERIRRAIEATLVVSATARDRSEPSPYKNALTLLGVLLAVLVVGMLYMVVKSRAATSSAPPPSPPIVSPSR